MFFWRGACQAARGSHLPAPSLKNDLIFLLTDGEEAGLIGARGFVQSSPLSKEIKLVVNFEARGTSGPVYMFETSSGNERLIREFGKAAPLPAASSLMFGIYGRMPNDTDLTVLKRAGWSGLNLAFIGNPEHYHQPSDDHSHSAGILCRVGRHLALCYGTSAGANDAAGPRSFVGIMMWAAEVNLQECCTSRWISASSNFFWKGFET
jgi:hypothetical protein